MSHYRLTDTAQADLDDIWAYIARDNPQNADRFLAKIEQMFQLLADHPLVGRSREGYGSTLRSYPIGKYLIFYIPGASGIEIRRVVHGQRKLSDVLEE